MTYEKEMKKADKELKTIIKNATSRKNLKAKLVQYLGIEGVIGFGIPSQIAQTLDGFDKICDKRFPNKKAKG